MHKPNDYVVHTPMTADQVLEKAAEIVANRYLRGDVFTNPQATKDFLQYKMAGYEREVFAVLLLDNQHRLIEYQELFFGTIDAASVYPREVVKVAFNCNAAAVIFAHNHPSGIAEPSNADKQITQKLKDALALIDIRVLDHFVVGETCISFAEQGYL
ncbi:RadC family protein [Photobacterium phosphoreum]|uniref:RadC family protein n=1 Tax=Photobacterium phosphoreum TaxID=659 RepID=UPI00242F3F27|nr:DNA repair protein RadC [Photobacterium phosphoreum]